MRPYEQKIAREGLFFLRYPHNITNNTAESFPEGRRVITSGKNGGPRVRHEPVIGSYLGANI